MRLRTSTPSQSSSSTTWQRELYNLAEDPLELENVAAEHPDQVERLRELISRRFATLAPSGQEEQELPDDLKRELEALGYVN